MVSSAHVSDTKRLLIVTLSAESYRFIALDVIAPLVELGRLLLITRSTKYHLPSNCSYSYTRRPSRLCTCKLCSNGFVTAFSSSETKTTLAPGR